MASYLKSVFLVALLIFMAVAEASPVSYEEVRRTHDRFCAFTIEQKRAVAACVLNGYPNVLRGIILACTPPEDTNGGWNTLVETMSYNCNPGQRRSPRRREFDACIKGKEEEATLKNQITGEDMERAENVYINCINEVWNES